MNIRVGDLERVVKHLKKVDANEVTVYFTIEDMCFSSKGHSTIVVKPSEYPVRPYFITENWTYLED